MQQDVQQASGTGVTLSMEIQERLQQLVSVSALAGARDTSLELLARASEEVRLSQGQTLLRGGVIETHAFLLLEGTLRLLGKDPVRNELFTVGRVQPGELVGVIDLLRQSPCEAAIARQPCRLLSLPLKVILDLLKDDPGLLNGLQALQSPCEGTAVLARILEGLNPLRQTLRVGSLNSLRLPQLVGSEDSAQQLLSSVLPGAEKRVGCVLTSEEQLHLSGSSNLPLRFWGWTASALSASTDQLETTTTRPGDDQTQQTQSTKVKTWAATDRLDLSAIGLQEASSDADLQGFKPIRGRGPVNANLATLRMVARAYGTPCPVDVLEKTLEGAVERSGSVPIQGMGQLAESMGLQTQVGVVKFDQLHRLELPVMVQRKHHYALITEVGQGRVLLADPEHGWVTLSMTEALESWGEQVQVVLLKRLDDTPKKTFGWGWFAPVIKRFQWPLLQVLLASLFIQLFQLANPLLIQQIIDKVISQSNLSALQVLGAALVASALFQGLLTAVRTWLLIDTTDRMDLMLGSQVIDKLLRLPLRFFEKRPVGELSQRLSELGNLRGFLTGTAITSALDLLFATIYILIMAMYSPLLTAVLKLILLT